MLKCSQTGFYDLNVSEFCFSSPYRDLTIENLVNLGFRTIAVNQDVDVDAYSTTESKKKKKKGEPREVVECVPAPFNLDELRNLAKNVTFLNRLTLIFSRQDSLQRFLKCSNFKKYDLIAVIPTTMQALAFVCSNLEADILSYDPQNKLNLKLNRKMYSQLIEKGFHFELTYAPAIQNSTKRKNLISLSHLYHTYGKSCNIIFSSGATSPNFIRGPYDIISLGFLFGLSELQSKNSVLYCPRKVTLNALGRRHGKALMIVENIVTMDINDTIIVESDEEENMDTGEPVQKKAKQ
ncbi:ribonuclease P protein subunit p30 isoform X1 [Euwallacea fornicatus]|uniref:ribonuclease P protein subunit p30 isoform X1 n=1 Tax=Euwallacea fornicatus TaxID=995702 RepID=UPI00338DC7A2